MVNAGAWCPRRSAGPTLRSGAWCSPFGPSEIPPARSGFRFPSNRRRRPGYLRRQSAYLTIASPRSWPSAWAEGSSVAQQLSIQLLRQISDTLAQLRGREVQDAVMRSDLRQLKIELADGAVVLVALAADEGGEPRLEVDVVRMPRLQGPQLEVRFDTA